MKSGRTVIVMLMTLFGVAIGAVAVVAVYGHTRVLPPETFADRVVASLNGDHVQSLVSGKLTAIVVERGGAAVDSATVETAIKRVVASPGLTKVARSQVEMAERRVTEGSARDFTVDLASARPLLVAQLQKIDPARAEMLRRVSGALPVTWEPPIRATTIRRIVDTVRIAAFAAPVLSALLLIVAFVIAPMRRLLLAWAGVLMVAGALTGLYAMQHLRSSALDRVPGDDGAYGAIWDIFVEGLRSWWIVTLGIGVFALVVGVVRPLRR